MKSYKIASRVIKKHGKLPFICRQGKVYTISFIVSVYKGDDPSYRGINLCNEDVTLLTDIENWMSKFGIGPHFKFGRKELKDGKLRTIVELHIPKLILEESKEFNSYCKQFEINDE